MEKKREQLNEVYVRLNDELKDAICAQMKELGGIKFNTVRSFPFLNIDGEYILVNVHSLKYDEETGNVLVSEESYGRMYEDWNIQYDGTVDGCIELLYYIEEEAYVKL